MADLTFDTYTGLKAAIAEWLARDDLAGSIPAFIRLAEAKITRALRRFSVRRTVPIFDEAFVLPADCAQLRSVRLVTGTPSLDTPIPILTPEALAEKRAGTVATGRPRYAAVLAGVGQDVLLLVPTPDQKYDVELMFYAQITPLAATNPTNIVLQEAPDVYLFGALAEAEPFLENDARVPLWKAKYDEAMSELRVARERVEYGASLRPMRLPVRFG